MRSEPQAGEATEVGHADGFRVANGLEAKAEIHKHREFQFWAEQTVSL